MPSDGKSSHCLWQGELKIEIISNIDIFPISNYKAMGTTCSLYRIFISGLKQPLLLHIYELVLYSCITIKLQFVNRNKKTNYPDLKYQNSFPSWEYTTWPYIPVHNKY